MNWHIGCSGFLYRGWKDVFYPSDYPQRRYFEYYASQFDTLELNVTFYKFPQLSALQKWYDTSPAHFLFSLKAPRLITHYRQMKDCERELQEFYTTVEEGLKDKVGCILFQFPPKFVFTEERLELIIKNLKPGIRNAVELRDKSWWDPTVINLLKENNISFCGISHPQLPANQEVIVNNNAVYYRFHGIPKLFYSEYREEELKTVADEILKKGKGVEDVFIYFNNTASLAAINNARFIRDYITQRV